MRVHKRKYTFSALMLASAALGVTIAGHAMEFKASGHINRAIIGANNGEESDVGFVEGGGSPSRFRFTGRQVMDNGFVAGFSYEIGMDTNSSSKWDINSTSDVRSAHLDTRHILAYVQGAFGKFTLGKGSAASDGTSEVDLSGTAFLGGGPMAQLYGGGITFLDDGGNSLGTVGSAYDHFDGLSRTNNVRYDSPSIGGIVLSTSMSEGHAYDVAVRYGGEVASGIKVAMAADWLDSESRGSVVDQVGNRTPGTNKRFQEYGGSASMLLPSGLNFTGVYKHRKYKGAIASTDSDNAKSYFGGIGYILDAHHFQVGWGQTKDLLNEGSKATQYSVAYKFDWTNNVELYASYHLMQLDDAYDVSRRRNADGQNINFVFLGTRIKFL